MSAQTHTPEPWTWGMVYVAKYNGVGYDHIAMHPSGKTQPENGEWEANARRIVACVNACVGMQTETLERLVGAKAGQPLDYVALTTQRDELAVALREFVRLDDESQLMATDGGELVSALQEARSALAKVRP